MKPGTDDRSPGILSPGSARIALLWKFIEYCGLLAFLLLIPPGMGADSYGKFAVFLSLLYLSWLTCSLGGQAAFARFIPEYRNAGENDKISAMFMQFLLLRVTIASLMSAVFFSLLAYLLPDLTFYVLLTATGVFVTGLVASTFYQLQFGLNNVGRWLCQDSSRRLLLIGLLLIFGMNFNFGNIVGAMLVVEVIFLVTGSYWAKPWFSYGQGVSDISVLMKYIRFGLAFFIGNLLLMAFWRSGDILILKFSSFASEVTYFSIANAIVMALYGLFSQLSILIMPSLMALRTQGEHERKIRWLSNTLKYITLIVFIVIFVLWPVAEPLIATVLGESFRPVAENLLILLFSLLPMNVIRLGMSSALVHDKQRHNAWVAGLALFVFLLSAVILIPYYGSIGAAAAIVTGASAGSVLAYYLFNMQKIISDASFLQLLLIGGAYMLLLYWLPLPALLLSILTPVLYVATLFLFRIIQIKEILWTFSRQNSQGQHGV
ncbi:MAG: lipopolysaccharide biosynthesis protein [Gammaproteobacteria bacterium]|nr:lipopolysaccharide biosynthesis protein [Gammaproteobacteria bacterium]